MMNSYRQNKGRRRLLIATVCVVLIFLVDILSGGALRALVRTGVRPIWGAGSGIVSGIFNSGFFSTRRALERENALLREQLTQSEARAAGYQALKDEHEALQGLLHVVQGARGITAPIISSLSSSPYGTFMIGAGPSDGIALGDLVLAGDSSSSGFAIGRISDVRNHTSLVTELFAPNVSTLAVIGGAETTVTGQGGGNARAEVPRDIPVAAGDTVRSPLVGGRPIGLVGAVHADPASASQQVYIGLPVGLSALQFVYVLQN